MLAPVAGGGWVSKVTESTLPPSALPTTKISLLRSLAMNSRPLRSNVTPVGRKQPDGHFAKLAFDKIEIAAVVDVGECIGWPVAGLKEMAKSL